MALGLVFSSFSKALTQSLDPAFRSVLFKGIGLAIVVLFGLFLAIGQVTSWLLGGVVSLPLIGEVNLSAAVSIASFFMALALSVFLMVPVASLMSSFFIEDVAEAVDRKHYPHLPDAQKVPFSQALSDTLGFFGVILFANLCALILYIFFAPFAPFIFWSLNGYLLGREYFQMVAARRIGRPAAKQMWRQNIGTLWFAGICMAAPLSIPLANLFVPILAAATFTHLFNQLSAHPFGGTSQDLEL